MQCLVLGCHSGTTPAKGGGQGKKMTILSISTLEDGAESKIGQLVFDDSNNATLSTEGSGPEAERLRRIWEVAAQRKSLPMQWTEKKKVDGDLVTTRKSKEVPKSDEQYPDAVWSFLESEHGYLVDQAN
jgi:hypothetical protein